MSRKLSILMIAAFFKPYINGDAVITEELSKRIGRTHNVTILTVLGNTGAPRQEEGENVKIYRVGVGSDFLDKSLFSLFAFLKSIFVKFDLVLGAGAYAGLAGLLIKITRGKPYILREDNGTMRGRFHAHPLLRPLVKTIYRKADLIIAVNNFMKRETRFVGASPQRTVVVPNGVDLNLFRVLNVDKNFFRIITVGRLEEVKGIEYLVRAAPEIVRQYPQAEILIVGDGFQRKYLEKLAEDLDVAGNIKFMGWVNNRRLPQLLNSAAVFVGPPVWEEGFGIIFAEALACGLAVVGTKSGGVPDTITDGINGLLVEKRDSQAIAEAVIRLLDDDNLRKKIIAGALVRAQELDWEIIARKYAELFKTIISSATNHG